MSPILDFDALRDSHNVANDLLHSPKIQKSLVRQRSSAARWVYEVSEASLTMLDVCGISKDVLSLVKEHLQDLQSTLRRVITIGEPDINDKIAAYNEYRKKLKKETLKCLHSLRGMKGKTVISRTCFNHDLVVVVDVLKDVRVTAISIVESLLALISTPWLDQKSSRGFFGKSGIFMRGHGLYDVSDVMEVSSANKRLGAVETAIENLEIEVECMSRRLIQTRVSLLNILTNYMKQ